MVKTIATDENGVKVQRHSCRRARYAGMKSRPWRIKIKEAIDLRGEKRYDERTKLDTRFLLTRQREAMIDCVFFSSEEKERYLEKNEGRINIALSIDDTSKAQIKLGFLPIGWFLDFVQWETSFVLAHRKLPQHTKFIAQDPNL